MIKKQDALWSAPCFLPFRIVHAFRQAKDIIGGDVVKFAKLDKIVYTIPSLSQFIL